MTKPFENIRDFEAIFKEYFNPLVNFVNRYLNNFENSREVVQQTFVKIWENREHLEVKTSIKSYIYQVTKNTMIDYVRKNKKHQIVNDLDTVPENEFLDIDESFLDPYIIKQAVTNSLKSLKPKAVEIFELHKFEGLTYIEIAEYLQISKRSVEDNVAKVLKHLNQELKNYSEFFE